MKNKISLLLITLILFSTVIFIFSIDNASAHKAKNSKKHKPTVCIPDSERTKRQLQNDKFWNNQHRLSKLQTDCLIVIKEKFGDELKALEEKLSSVAECGETKFFRHKASNNTKLYQKPDAKSKEIAKVKKNDELLFHYPSEKDKNWYYVKIHQGKACADGYIDRQFVVKKGGVDVVVYVDPNKLIEIKYPKWAKDKEDKLILVDAEGTVSITGAVQEGKIDQIIINEEEEIINSDNSFTYIMFVPSSGAQVRIIGYKNGEKVKELIFKVKVGK